MAAPVAPSWSARRPLYDQTVAQYRQAVLDSFREVEDYLVQLRVLQQQEAAVQQEALDAARESLRLVENQYRAGTAGFQQRGQRAGHGPE